MFHPVMTENAETTIGRDGKIDFIACLIMDEKVTEDIRDGVEYNVVNSKGKGKKVPEEVVKSVADGYWAEADMSFYAGVNETGKGNVSPGKIILWCLAGTAAVALAVIVFGLIRVRSEEKKKEEEAKTDTDEAEEAVIAESLEPTGGEKISVDAGEDVSKGPKDMTGSEAGDDSNIDNKTDLFMQKVTKDGLLTGRELDVLREYLAGKTRTEISEALFISESTVKNHISSIFAKTGVKNKKELLALVEKM